MYSSKKKANIKPNFDITTNYARLQKAKKIKNALCSAIAESWKNWRDGLRFEVLNYDCFGAGNAMWTSREKIKCYESVECVPLSTDLKKLIGLRSLH